MKRFDIIIHGDAYTERDYCDSGMYMEEDDFLPLIEENKALKLKIIELEEQISNYKYIAFGD